MSCKTILMRFIYVVKCTVLRVSHNQIKGKKKNSRTACDVTADGFYFNVEQLFLQLSQCSEMGWAHPPRKFTFPSPNYITPCAQRLSPPTQATNRIFTLEMRLLLSYDPCTNHASLFFSYS